MGQLIKTIIALVATELIVKNIENGNAEKVIKKVVKTANDINNLRKANTNVETN